MLSEPEGGPLVPLPLLATAVTLWAPWPSALVWTAYVPLGATPLPTATPSTRMLTVAPAAALPVKVGVVTLVRLSAFDAPESLAAARSGVDGAPIEVTPVWMPVPLSATENGLGAAVVWMTRLAVRGAAVVGLKTTPTLHGAFGPRTWPLQPLLPMWKSPASLKLIPVTLSDAVPVFVRVTICALLAVPTCWLPKLRLVGLRLTAAAGVGVAWPLRLTPCRP